MRLTDARAKAQTAGEAVAVKVADVKAAAHNGRERARGLQSKILSARDVVRLVFARTPYYRASLICIGLVEMLVCTAIALCSGSVFDIV